MGETLKIIFQGEGRAGAPEGLYEVDLDGGCVVNCPVPLEIRRNCLVEIYSCCAAVSENGVQISFESKTIGFVCVDAIGAVDMSNFINPSTMTDVVSDDFSA